MLKHYCRQLCKEILAGEEFQQILPQGQRWTEELQQYLEELVSTRKGLRAGLNLPTEVGCHGTCFMTLLLLLPTTMRTKGETEPRRLMFRHDGLLVDCGRRWLLLCTSSILLFEISPRGQRDVVGRFYDSLSTSCLSQSSPHVRNYLEPPCLFSSSTLRSAGGKPSPERAMVFRIYETEILELSWHCCAGGGAAPQRMPSAPREPSSHVPPRPPRVQYPIL